MALKPKSFQELFAQAEEHADYGVAGAILEFTEGVVREMAYVTKILRGKANFTLETMVRLARALGAELRVQIATEADQPALQAVGGARSS
jgi:hypothetical protein